MPCENSKSPTSKDKLQVTHPYWTNKTIFRKKLRKRMRNSLVFSQTRDYISKSSHTKTPQHRRRYKRSSISRSKNLNYTQNYLHQSQPCFTKSPPCPTQKIWKIGIPHLKLSELNYLRKSPKEDHRQHSGLYWFPTNSSSRW